MLGNLLIETTQVVTYILLGVILVMFVVWIAFSGRKNKERQKEYEEQLAALRPGHKVKTAGEICESDNTVIIETGSESAGKSYIKMDKELIAQTDAKGPTQIAREEAEAARKAAKAGVVQTEEKAVDAQEVETPVEESVSEPETTEEDK